MNNYSLGDRLFQMYCAVRSLIFRLRSRKDPIRPFEPLTEAQRKKSIEAAKQCLETIHKFDQEYTTRKSDELMSDPDSAWSRIVANQGKTFHQIKGKPFTYTIKGNVLNPNTTNQNIPRSHFEEAFKRMPFENTVPLQDLRGPSYIFAILTDPRITR